MEKTHRVPALGGPPLQDCAVRCSGHQPHVAAEHLKCPSKWRWTVDYMLGQEESEISHQDFWILVTR